MTVAWMRRLDRWVGVPLCALLTIVRRVTEGVSSGAPSSPRRVLFVELPEMGSLVLASPAIAQLRALHPEVQIYVLVFASIRESVTVLNLTPAERVLTIDPSNPLTLVRDVFRLALTGRRLGIDTAINLEIFARLSTILCYLSGARTRVGFWAFGQPGVSTGDLFTHRVQYNAHVHASQSFLSLVQALDEPVSDWPMGKFRTPPLPVLTHRTVSADARARIWSLVTRDRPAVAGKRLILINPNASAMIPVRRWPLDRYAELVRKLLDDPSLACVVTGTAPERTEAQFIVDRVNSDRVIDLTGKTSLADLLDLYAISDLMVSNDSGPAQYAALTGMHVVVFFGPETPALYGPLSDNCTVLYSHFACSPCVSAYNQRVTQCTDNKCVQAFSVDDVYARVVEILKGKMPS